VPRREKRCPDCLDKGYLSLLGRRHGDERKIVACRECRHGRRFLRVWRAELAKVSPPTKLKSRPVRPEPPADHDIREDICEGERPDGVLRFHEGD